MKVTQVSILPTDQARAAGRPALTPELLAASGARYSRNNEGLESILAKIDPENMDRAVDTIFRLIDYGHQSIADMAPVAMFIDRISIWLAFYVWSICPTAGGQESSTRYIQIAPDACIPPDRLGIPAIETKAWEAGMQAAFEAYRQALACWQTIGEASPASTAIPAPLLADSSDRARKTVARMQRNYRFDRARYYLPVAAATNMMMVMSARGWVRLCQHLCSHPLPEANLLGEAIHNELGLSAPRLLKHAQRQKGIANGMLREWCQLQEAARQTGLPPCLAPGSENPEAPTKASLQILPPPDVSPEAITDALRDHENRYGWTGSALQRTAIICRWEAMAMGEIRDLNRHRTGTRHCPLLPQGFYAAREQIPANLPEAAQNAATRLIQQETTGRDLTAQTWQHTADGHPSAVYWSLLGSQFVFERTTTADKFLYEAELRTGLGAHYRYAKHYRDALNPWYRAYPDSQPLVLEGTAEPE